MMVVLRVLALLLMLSVTAFLLWVLFVNLTGRESSRWFGGRPGSLGVRDGKLAPNDMKGAGITITNIGSVGGTYATPVINHPEVAILGVSKSSIKPGGCAVYEVEEDDDDLRILP